MFHKTEYSLTVSYGYNLWKHYVKWFSIPLVEGQMTGNKGRGSFSPAENQTNPVRHPLLLWERTASYYTYTTIAIRTINNTRCIEGVLYLCHNYPSGFKSVSMRSLRGSFSNHCNWRAKYSKFVPHVLQVTMRIRPIHFNTHTIECVKSTRVWCQNRCWPIRASRHSENTTIDLTNLPGSIPRRRKALRVKCWNN